MGLDARSARGTTMVEVVIGMAILAIVLLAIAMLLRTGLEAHRDAAAAGSARSRARRTVARIARELAGGSAISLGSFPEAPNWRSAISFERVQGVSRTDGVLAYSAATIQLLPEAGETADGLDNDGDGLVDEGQVVLTRNPGDPGATTTVLARSVRARLAGETDDGEDENGNGLVDESGLVFSRLGDTVTVRITIASVDGSFHTARTSIRLRN